MKKERGAPRVEYRIRGSDGFQREIKLVLKQLDPKLAALSASLRIRMLLVFRHAKSLHHSSLFPGKSVL